MQRAFSISPISDVNNDNFVIMLLLSFNMCKYLCLILYVILVQSQTNNSSCDFTARQNDLLRAPKSCCGTYSLV
jgi:hypothetical protein